MPRVYIDAVPLCEHGHTMWRNDSLHGQHTGSFWTCINPGCEYYLKALVVPHQVVEALVVGEVKPSGWCECGAAVYPWGHAPGPCGKEKQP